LRNIENEKHAHYNAHFKEELDSLKANMVRIDSLLKQALRMPLVKVFPIDLTLFFKLKWQLCSKKGWENKVKVPNII
jgi:hypothetical protein